jgi:hypothetical protein
VGQAPPLAARPQHIEDRIENVAPRVLARAPGFAAPWQQRLEQLPFVVGEIGRIRDALHPFNLHTLSLMHPLFRQFLKAFLRTDGAPVASLNEQLVSDCLRYRHN